MTLRFSSSGTRWSKQRLPASMWKTGTFRRFAEMTASPELVSPYIRTWRPAFQSREVYRSLQLYSQSFLLRYLLQHSRNDLVF